jgi:hypothetical protein
VPQLAAASTGTLRPIGFFTFLGGFFGFAAIFVATFGLESTRESGNNHDSLLEID